MASPIYALHEALLSSEPLSGPPPALTRLPGRSGGGYRGPPDAWGSAGVQDLAMEPKSAVSSGILFDFYHDIPIRGIMKHTMFVIGLGD